MIKKNIFGLIFFFLLMSNAFGMTLKPSGDVEGGPGEEITIYLNFTKTNEEEALTGIEGVLSYDENILTLKSQEKLLSESWTYYNVVNNKKFAFLNLNWSDETLLNSTNINISKLIFLINPNASGKTDLTISKLEAADRDGNSVSINGGSHVIKILSNVNTLSSIKIDGVNIADFDPNKTEYSKTVDVENINIEAVKNDSKSTYVSGYGNREVSLKEGLNTILIKVQAENGDIKTYTLNITRTPKSTVNTLKTLALSKGTINFNSNTFNYDVIVDNSVTSVTISSTLTDSKSKYVDGYGNRTVNLNVGLNTILIKVQAENGDVKTYTLNIRRKSNVNTLKTLVLSKGTISFNPNTINYNVTVNNDVEKITISSTLTDSKSTYVEGYGNREVNLNVGLNTVLIKVQAENGEVRTYTLNITRKSNVNTLKTLTLSSGSISFNPNTINYNVTVNNDIEKITISSTLTDSKSTYVSGYGNREVKLNVGLNTILIKVQSENGEVRTYTLNITRKSNVNTLKTLMLSSGSISFNSNTTSYNVVVNNEINIIKITSTLTDETSKYVDGYGDRQVNLNVGLNTILIKVEAESGEVRTYTLNITRKSNVNTLKTLTLSSGSISFNPNTTEYTVTVNNDIEKITISSTLTDSKSTYVSGYGNREVKLNVGLNTILIKVQSENGDIKVYALNVSRKSKINTLKTLTLSSGTINFDPNIVAYNVTVNNNIDKITISSTLTDSKSTYVSGYGNRQVNLNVGLNVVQIKVKSENGEISTYTLNIRRKSNVNTLKTLTLSSGSITFNSNTTTYNLVVNNEVDIIKITSTLTDETSKYVSGYGNRQVSLKEGLNTVLIKVESENGEIKTYTLNITRKSGVNTLKTLTLSSGTINFNPNTLNYDVVVNNNVDKIRITSTLTDSKSKYVDSYGNREVSLKEGLNTVLIKVESEDGSVRTYTLNITRKSSVNTLKTLKLSSGTINFNPNITTYDVIVNNNVDKITITSTLTDAKSKYVSGYGNGDFNLKEGLNTILIKVQAESGNIKTYTINISRKSKVNTLKTLTLSTGKINFNPNVIDYNVTVDNNVEKITISSTLTDSRSKYVERYGNREVTLKEGLNKVLIKVESENGEISTYTLNIIRKNKVDNNENNVNIKYLTIKNYPINFNSEKTEYTLKIKDEISLNIEVVLTDTNSTYKILNNNNLENGSIITIEVTSSDKQIVKSYKIHIEKGDVIDLPVVDEEDEKDNNIAYVALAILSIGIIGLIGSIIYKKRK